MCLEPVKCQCIYVHVRGSATMYNAVWCRVVKYVQGIVLCCPETNRIVLWCRVVKSNARAMCEVGLGVDCPEFPGKGSFVAGPGHCCHHH